MDWITFVPEYDGNRDVAEEKQITAEILPLTVREQRRVAGAVTAKRVRGGGFKTNQAELNIKTLGNHIRNITNLSWNGKPVTSFDGLLDTPYVELADELEQAMQTASILDEGNVKNLRSQSLGQESVVESPSTAGTVAQNDND